MKKRKRGRPTKGAAAKRSGLTLRLDAKTRYALQLVVKQRGTTVTALVETVIHEAAKKLELDGRTWLNLWDDDPAIRKLLEIGCSAYVMTPDEEEMRSFTRAHRAHWYTDPRCTIPKRPFVEVLFPKMQHYIHAWRSTDSATELMNKDLRAAKLQPPK